MNPPEISCIEAHEHSSVMHAADDLNSSLLNGDLLNKVLLDVREADEWSAGHAPSAIHSSLGSLGSLDPATFATAFPAGVKVMCICRSGGRSAEAVAMLRSAGIDAVNVSGGMNAWAAAELPMVAEGPSPAKVL